MKALYFDDIEKSWLYVVHLHDTMIIYENSYYFTTS